MLNSWPMGAEAQTVLPELNSTLGPSEIAARTETGGIESRKAPGSVCLLLTFKNDCLYLTAGSCPLLMGEKKRPAWGSGRSSVDLLHVQS